MYRMSLFCQFSRLRCWDNLQRDGAVPTFFVRWDSISCRGALRGVSQYLTWKPAILTGFILPVIVSLPLIAFGPNMNESAFHSAAKNDDVVAIKNLLSKGTPIDARDGSGCTALLVATHGNKVNAARALIEAGADVNAKDNINDSAYLYAGARATSTF